MPTGFNHRRCRRTIDGNTKSSNSSIREFISYVTCSSTDSSTGNKSRDITLLGSHLFNCGANSDQYSQQRPPSTKVTKETIAGTTAMQRASVSRRTDTNQMSPGLRSRSSERHVDVEADNDLNTTFEHNSNITGNMEKPSSNDLYRSMSDPFDTAQNDDVVGGTAGTASDEDEDLYVLAASTSQISIQNDSNSNTNNATNGSTNHIIQIPTFARYPCIENKNKNCWSEPPITIFQVRGMNYCTDQKKVPSQPYLLRSRGSDIFLTDPKKPFSLDSMYVLNIRTYYK